MAVIGKKFGGDREGGRNYVQACLDENYLKAVKPNVEKGVTRIRIVPEVAPDGAILPTVRDLTDAGPDVTNLLPEYVATSLGAKNRFSGFIRPVDANALQEDDAALPFLGLYIRLVGRKNRNELSPTVKKEVEKLLDKGKNISAPLSRPKLYGIVQAIVLELNGKTLKKPSAKQAVFLTTTAVEALSDAVVAAHKQGVDLFSPDQGCELVFTPETQRGSGIKMFNVAIGDAVPLDEDTCRKLWVPWDKVTRFHTYEDLFRAMVGCYGHNLVREAFEDDYEYFYGAASAPTAPAPEAPAEEPVVTRRPAPAAKAQAPATLQIDLDSPPESLEDDGESEEDEPASSSTYDPDEEDDAEDAVLTPEERAKRYQSLLSDSEDEDED